MALIADERSIAMPRRGAGCCSAFARGCSAAPDFPVERAGERWALVDLARHSARREDARGARAARARVASGRMAAPLRPLGMLAALARRDVGRGPAPGRGRARRRGCCACCATG